MVEFSVIEERGKVVARLTNCSMDAYNILAKKLPPYMEISPWAVQMRSVFKASAKCHPDDVFDVEKGKALAKERVIAKYNQAMANILIEVGNDIDAYLSDYLDGRIDHFDRD